MTQNRLLFQNDAALTAAYDVIRANLLVRLGMTGEEKKPTPVVAVSSVGKYSKRRESFTENNSL